MKVTFEQEVTVDCNDWAALIDSLCKPDEDGRAWNQVFWSAVQNNDEQDYFQSRDFLVEQIGLMSIQEPEQWASQEVTPYKFLEGFGKFSNPHANLWVWYENGIYIVVSVGEFEAAWSVEQDNKGQYYEDRF